MLYDPNNPSQLMNVRNEEVPDVFPLEHQGQRFYVHISPFVWMRPWEGKEHTGFSVGLAPGCPNACRAFGLLKQSYLSCTLEDVADAARQRIDELGLDYFLSRGMGVAVQNEHLQGGFTLVSDDPGHRRAFEAGYQYVVHIYQLRGGGIRRHVTDWYFYGEPQQQAILLRLRQDQTLHPDAMHYEIGKLTDTAVQSAS
ncbi:hypothetical protein [Alteromonas sp. CYL-A6]|uniref:hypothetical protein n=1 Tax=Alteromonas nitratireducens TaxID=3390813 RepID=UPI0034BA4803